MESHLVKEAQEKFHQSICYYHGKPVGTVAANEGVSPDEELNYGECFIRDFFTSGLAFLMEGQREIVRNFLEVTLGLQFDSEGKKDGQGLFENIRQFCYGQEPQMGDGIRPGQGVMPASFAITSDGHIKADFGQRAIGRVTPVDSGLWWIFLLRAYEKACQIANVPEESIAHRKEFQRGIQLILELCLSNRFDMTPTMLVPEGAFMIDRRLGVYGHPLEIQALFYIVLRSSLELLDEFSLAKLNIYHRLEKLRQYIRDNYWLDPNVLRKIYRYRTEEFGEKAFNKFNIYANTVPDWVLSWLDGNVGYFMGNLGVTWIDFRFFSQGNLLAIISDLAAEPQGERIMNLIDLNWSKIVGEMPLKICYPAVMGRDWEIITGCDPKNVPWSYHNGGNWPVLLWPFVAAAQKTGNLNLAKDAVEIAEKYLQDDEWPEYYEGEEGKLIGRQSRLYQTWTIAGYLISKYLLDNPGNLELIQFG